jgi:hypothetical protein
MIDLPKPAAPEFEFNSTVFQGGEEGNYSQSPSDLGAKINQPRRLLMRDISF